MNQNQYSQAIIPLLWLSLSLPFSSCQTVHTIDASRFEMPTIGSKPRSGNFYFLPKVLLRVSGSYIDEKNTFEISLERILIPDKSARRFVEYNPNSWAEDEISFIVNSKGLIDGGFLSVAEDKTGAVIETLADTAINVWKIGSYGPVEGLVGADSFLAGSAETPAPKQTEKLIPFEWTFDPYSQVPRNGKSIGNFFVKVHLEVDEKSPCSPTDDLLAAPSRKPNLAKGLLFRAPDVVHVTIESSRSSVARTKNGGGAAEGEESSILAGAGATESLISAPAITADQKTGNIYKWRIFNASSNKLDFDSEMAVKTVDLSPEAEVAFSFSRSAFVKKGIALSFVDGELLGTHIQKPSEVKAFVDIPKNITTDIASAFPTLIKISDTRASRDLSSQMQDQLMETERLKAQAGLLAQRHALLENQLKIIKAEAAIDDAEE